MNICKSLVFPLLSFFAVITGYFISCGRAGRINLLIDLFDILLIISVIYYFGSNLLKKNHTKICFGKFNEFTLYFFLIVCVQLLSTYRGLLIQQVDNIFLPFFRIILFFTLYLAAFFTFRSFKTCGQISSFIKLLAFFTFLFCCYALSSKFIYGNRFLFPLSYPDYSGLSTNEFGLFYVLLFCFFFGVFSEEKKIPLKSFYFILLVLLELCSIFLFNRIVFLFFHFILLFIVFLQKKKFNVVILIFFAALFLTVCSTNKNISGYISKTFEGKSEFRLTVGLDGTERYIRLNDSPASKIAIYEAIVSYWREYPVFGLGLTGAGQVKSQFFLIFGETGIAGVTVNLLFVLFFWRLSSNIERISKEPVFIGAAKGFKYLLIASCVMGFFISLYLLNVFLAIFGVFAGIILRIKFITGVKKNEIISSMS